MRLALPALALALLPGCFYFFGDPDRPVVLGPGEGEVACGDTVQVVDMRSATELPIAVNPGTTVTVRTDLSAGDPGTAALLIISSDSTLQNLGEFEDGPSGERMHTGYIGPGERAALRFYVPADQQFAAGEVSVECSLPGEACTNSADDDGDGLLDCADRDCARNPDCVSEQADASPPQVVPCSTGAEDIYVPTVGAQGHQNTLYFLPQDDDDPLISYWGGAEVILQSPWGPGDYRLQFGADGFLCAGTPMDGAIRCDSWQRVAAGDDLTLPSADTTLYLEPAEGAWPWLRAGVDCNAEGRDAPPEGSGP